MKIELPKILSVIILITFTNTIINAQQFKIGKNLYNLKTGAILELEDSAKALILTRIADPSIKIGVNSYRGMLVFDSLKNQIAYYDGTTWIYPSIGASDTNIYKYDGTLKGNRTVTMNNNNLRFLGNAGNNTLSLASNGNVGIGTTDSIYRLNIKGGTSNSVGDVNSRIIAINGAPVVYFDNNNSFAFGATTTLKSLQSNTGILNLAVGPGALEKNTTGQKNVGVGATSLRSNTTGNYNTVIGSLALYYNEIGSHNVAIGSDAMGGNNSSSSNVNNNVAIGSQALYSLKSNFNVGIGYKALYYNENGINNVVIGTNAGNINSTGGIPYTGDYSNNILIGNNVRVVNGQNNNTLNIGNVITGINIDSLNINAKIGLGLGTNRSPISRLQVSGAVRADSLVLNSLTSGALDDSILTINTTTGVVGRILASSIKPAIDTSIYSYDGILKDNRVVVMNNNNLLFNSGNGNFIFNPTGTGRVGIGTVLPYSNLDIVGNIFLTTHSDNNQHATTERGIRRIGQKSGNGAGDGFNGLEFEVSSSPANIAENAGLIKFYTWGSSISTNREVARIDPYGRLGIGTNNPTQKLSIGNTTLVSSATPDAITLGGTFSNTAGQNLKIRLVENTTQAWGFGVSTNQLDYAVPSGSNHVFYINNTEQMRIAANGNVGIGTTTPSRGLQVVKGIVADSLTLAGSNSLLKFVKGITGNSSLLMEFYKNGTSVSDYGARSGFFGFGSSGNNNFVIMNQLKGLFQLGTNNVNVMTIDTFANVGIGNTNPISALHVRGAMRADSLVLSNLSLDTNTYNATLTIDVNGVVRQKTLVSTYNNILQGIKNTGGNAFRDTVRIGSYDAQPVRLLASNSPSITIKPTGTLTYAPLDSSTIYLRNIAYDASSNCSYGGSNKLPTITGNVSNIIDGNGSTYCGLYTTMSPNVVSMNVNLNGMYYIDSVVVVPYTASPPFANQGIAGMYVKVGTSTGEKIDPAGTHNVNGVPFGYKLNTPILGNQVTFYGTSFNNGMGNNIALSQVYIYGRRAKAVYSGPTETRINGTFAMDNVATGATTDSILVINNSIVKKIAPLGVSANSWSLSGNAGTSSTTNFIGTTDNNDIIFKRNNTRAGWINSSLLNTAFGVNSLNPTSTGNQNTAFGYNALQSMTSGTWNTALGSTAMPDNISGNDNTAVGVGALYLSQTGSENTALGKDALRNMKGTQGGEYNTAIGSKSLYNAGGNYNVGVGYNLFSNLGINAQSPMNYNIVIGVNIDTLAGKKADSTLNIGKVITGTGLYSTNAKIGINLGMSTLPTHALQVNGSTGSGAYTDGTTWSTGSDSRLKKDIMPSTYGLKEVMQLRPQFYVYKADVAQKRDVGFIAQDVQKIIPEVVSGKEGDVSKGETLGISYGNLTAVLVSAIQEQQAQIQSANQKIESQQKQIDELKAMLQKLLEK